MSDEFVDTLEEVQPAEAKGFDTDAEPPPSAKASPIKKDETAPRAKGRPPKADKTPRSEYRLQVKMNARGKARLDELVERLGSDTAANMVRDALRVYDILTEEVLVNGNELYLHEKETGKPAKLRLW